MIGFCLAAGAGTRLRPLTRAVPKPLLAPAGRPLVELAIEALQAAGATRVVVNAHHGADQLVARLAGRAGVEVVVEPVLLGTGGGLVNAARLGLLGDGDDPVLVTAADHVVDPTDLVALAAFLEESGAPMAAGLVPTTTDPFPLRLEWPGPDPAGPNPGPNRRPDSAGPDPPPGLWTARGSSEPGGVPSPTGGPGSGAGSPGGVSSPTGGPGSGAGRSATPPDEPLRTERQEPRDAATGALVLPDLGTRGQVPPDPHRGGQERWDPGRGGRVLRDPGGGWGSAGIYAVRAGLLCDLEPGYATLVDRVLGPLLAAGRLVGLPVRGAVADAGTLARLLDVSAGLLTGRWPYALPPGRLVHGTPAGTWELGPAGDGGTGAPAAAGGSPSVPARPTSALPEPPHLPPGSGSVAPGPSLIPPGPASLAPGSASVGPRSPRVPPGSSTVAPGSAGVEPGSAGVLWGPVFVAEGVEVDPGAVLAGPVVLDVGCRVGAGAVVTRSVVGPGAVVGSGACVAGSFLGPGARVPSGAMVAAGLVPSAAPPPPTQLPG